MSPGRRRAARIAGAVLALLAWILVARLLWRTTVPAHLVLPHVDVDRSLSPRLLERAEHFSRVERLVGVLQIAVLLGALTVYARRGARFARESAAGRIGTGMLLAMLGFAVVWLAQLPFGVFELWWQRRYGLVDIGYLDWLVEEWAALGSTFLFVCLGVLVVMALARPLGRHWWIGAAPVFVGLLTLNIVVAPWLLGFSTHPLRDRKLAAAEVRLAEREDVDAVPIRVADFEASPNAFAIGLGPTRRIFIFQSFFDGQFADDEIEVVIAHELGHHAHDHLWKLIGLFALFTVPGSYLIARWTRRRGGMGEAAAVPLGLLVYTVLTIAALPVQNAFSRRYEAEADWAALHATQKAHAAARLFRHFVPESLDDPSPPAWDVVLFGSHPTLEQRLEMVEAWRRRNG